MTITAALVKELRDRTQAGMMECKKALTETNGDIELAVKKLREDGVVKADKKASRTAAEGTICIKADADNKNIVMLEINCETDFVARDAGFLDFVKNTAEAALNKNVTDDQQLLEQKTSSQETVDLARRNLISKIGENITIRRFTKLATASGSLGSYSHNDRIGVIVELEGGSANLAKDIAMHIAAAAPIVVSPEDVPADVIEKEREIFSAQAKQSGKPAEIVEKMIVGRINKYLDEISLLGQAFIKDPNVTIAKLLASNGGAKVKSFVRYQVGEGIEKKQDDFATEVMAQVKGAN